MGKCVTPSKDPYRVVWAAAPEPGSLGVILRESKLQTVLALQEHRAVQRFKVRGYISDHIPLIGSLDEILGRPLYHNIVLENGNVNAYLQSGKREAFYFKLSGKKHQPLEYIEVEVECELPTEAFFLARKPLNIVVDWLVGDRFMPLVLAHLSVHVLDDDEPLAHEIFLPFPQTLPIGTFGGILKPQMFASYHAIFREALYTISPFYRLLCAYKIYEGVRVLRRTIKRQCQTLGVVDAMPKDPSVDIDELEQLGMSSEFIHSIHTANDLFGKFKEHRDAVAHFLLEKNKTHLNISSAESVLEYSTMAAILLRYAWKAINDVGSYYAKHIQFKQMIGSVLQNPDSDLFVIRSTTAVKPGNDK